jgi:hypothetical protein
VLGKLVAQRQLPKLWEARSRLVQQFDAERVPPEDDDDNPSDADRAPDAT